MYSPDSANCYKHTPKKLRNPKKVGVGTLTAYSSPAILQLTKHDKPLSGAWNFH